MTKIIASPNRYIQGKGELHNLAMHASMLGDHLFLLIDKNIKSFVLPTIASGMNDTTYDVLEFDGECCMAQIHQVMDVVKSKGGNVIIGVGGGKTHDLAKAVGYYTNHPVVIVPTSASTDAPCSAISVIYTETGIFDKYLYLPSNPNIVLVDTEVISKAPSRLLAAGMGDALATYFEARACWINEANNCVGGKITKAAMALAKLCYETLLEDGVSAYLAVKNKTCTKAVENIIEANIYLSGIGFESGGLAIAHAVHNGLTVFEETRKFYHGEKVAFGTLVQLVLEKAPMKEIEDVVRFCQQIGLPTTLAELDVKDIKTSEIMEVANRAYMDTDAVGNITPKDIFTAILTADEVGKKLKKEEESR